MPRTNAQWTNAQPGEGRALACGVPDDDLLSHGRSTLSSACRRFTVLFGMGRRGANGLWSSGIDREQRSGIRDQRTPWRGRCSREEVEVGLIGRKHRSVAVQVRWWFQVLLIPDT